MDFQAYRANSGDWRVFDCKSRVDYFPEPPTEKRAKEWAARLNRWNKEKQND